MSGAAQSVAPILLRQSHKEAGVLCCHKCLQQSLTLFFSLTFSCNVHPAVGVAADSASGASVSTLSASWVPEWDPPAPAPHPQHCAWVWRAWLQRVGAATKEGRVPPTPLAYVSAINMVYEVGTPSCQQHRCMRPSCSTPSFTKTWAVL